MRHQLLAVALTEMSARPMGIRALEWAAVLPLRIGLLGSPGRAWAARRSVGAFQLRNARFRIDRACADAADAFRSRGLGASASFETIALEWNGPASESQGGVRYAEVLAHASQLVTAAA